MGSIHCGSTMLYLPASALRGLFEGLGAPLALPSHGIFIAYFIEQYHSCFSVVLAAHRVYVIENMFLIKMHEGRLSIFSMILSMFLIFTLLTTVISSFI